MDYKTQIFCLVISFIYGIFFSMCANINYKYLFAQRISYKILFNVVFILDIVLLYVLIIYKINNGIFHIYFIIMIALGFSLSFNRIRMLTSNVNVKSWLAKKKKK